MEQAISRRISIPVARRLAHLAAILDALGDIDAAAWFETRHGRLLGESPRQLLQGEWEPVHPAPATLLSFARSVAADTEDF